MAQWTLTDNSTGTPEVLTFDWNPDSFNPPGRQGTTQNSLTTAPNGQLIVFQGRDQARTARFSGKVGTQSFFTSLDTWKDKWYPLVLTDDQGQTWDIVIQQWTWERIRRANNQWRYNYTAEVLVL